jgi:hypothetical protein
MYVAAACEGTVFPVWMNNADLDIGAFEVSIVHTLSMMLGSKPAQFTSLDDIERKYGNQS